MYSKCQKCGRKLTDPESIERGYGPDFLEGLKNGGEKDMS